MSLHQNPVVSTQAILLRKLLRNYRLSREVFKPFQSHLTVARQTLQNGTTREFLDWTRCSITAFEGMQTIPRQPATMGVWLPWRTTRPCNRTC